jgi:hypothetical protein
VPATFPEQANYIFRTLFGLAPHDTNVPDSNGFLVWTFPISAVTSSNRVIPTYTEPTPWDMYSLNMFSLGFESADYAAVYAAVQGCTSVNALNSIATSYSRLLPFNLSNNAITEAENFPVTASTSGTGVDIKYMKYALNNPIIPFLHKLNGQIALQFDIVYAKPTVV